MRKHAKSASDLLSALFQLLALGANCRHYSVNVILVCEWEFKNVPGTID